MDTTTYQQARLARDARFDGQFFVAVTTTGIFCRPICPAPPPREQNVRYFTSAIEAAQAGFRPCLRCRPDSAPASWAWKGTDTTLERALSLIDDGALIDGSVSELCDRLGISSRYLARLFQEKLGASPKQYALYQQVLFAKSLLQQTALPIADIAFASGFGSLRRFNDCFVKTLRLSPRDIRRQGVKGDSEPGIALLLSYRPPYDWASLQGFLERRLIPGLEWTGQDHYGRTFQLENGLQGHFTARHCPEQHAFRVQIDTHQPGPLLPLVRTIRRLLDLDADSRRIDAYLAPIITPVAPYRPGLRLPGILSLFEAGVRAILGQQISVTAARNLVAQLVQGYGLPAGQAQQAKRFFPTPEQLADQSLEVLKIPQRRRQSLIDFSRYMADPSNRQKDPEHWRPIKGIGDWTIRYARMRGMSDCDVWLGSDLGIQKALQRTGALFDPAAASPWQSYLTFQLWSQP
ncbi:MAG: AlkA N-terminal domain-containing protein [Saccharospirillum sp.]